MEILSLRGYENKNQKKVKGYKNVSLSAVCNRMRSLSKSQPFDLVEDILLHFKERRNLGVHENYFLSHSETDYNMVKDIVDSALDEVISGKIKTGAELVSYYRAQTPQ
jgi:hypothetical protein